VSVALVVPYGTERFMNDLYKCLMNNATNMCGVVKVMEGKKGSVWEDNEVERTVRKTWTRWL